MASTLSDPRSATEAFKIMNFFNPLPPCRSLRSLSRRSVEEEFPHLYAHGCTLRDICADCTKFIADVISSSRRSLDILNNTPKRQARAAAAAAPAERPQPPCESHHETHPTADAHSHPPLHPMSKHHPHLPPQSHHQQQRPQTPPSSSLPQRYTKTINSVNQWADWLTLYCFLPTHYVMSWSTALHCTQRNTGKGV